MPKKWSEKDERMYEHIRDNEKDRGKSVEKAEEIAARTVNKQRRREVRTENTRSQGTGNPNIPLEDRPVDELQNRARRLNISGRSTMRKRELVREIRARQ